jgi:hypothetical protein
MFGHTTNRALASSGVRMRLSRQLPVTLQRCADQARSLRAAAAASASGPDRVRLLHMADAYDSLAARRTRM